MSRRTGPVLGFHPHSDFHRRSAHEVDARFHDHEIPDVDRLAEIHPIDRDSHARQSRVTDRRYSGGSVHHRQHHAPEYVAQHVGMLWHHELSGFVLFSRTGRALLPVGSTVSRLSPGVFPSFMLSSVLLPGHLWIRSPSRRVVDARASAASSWRRPCVEPEYLTKVDEPAELHSRRAVRASASALRCAPNRRGETS